MNERPLVSIIINVHNGAQYIGEAIDSAFGQTYQNIEIVVYDNASDDGLNAILTRYDEKLKVFRSEEFLALGAARNRAIDCSKGEFFCFLDSDDVMLPEKIEKQLPHFTDDVALVFSNSIFFWENDGVEKKLYPTPPKDGMIFKELLEGYYLSLETVMLRRSSLGEDQKWWFPETFNMCEEAEIFMRLSYKFPVKYVDEVLAKYRIHDSNWTHTRMELLVTEKREMLQRFSESIPHFEIEFADSIRFFKDSIFYHQAILDWRDKKRISATKNIINSYKESGNKKRLIIAALSLILSYNQFTKLKRVFGSF